MTGCFCKSCQTNHPLGLQRLALLGASLREVWLVRAKPSVHLSAATLGA